ncbi:MAG: dicarboxylate/amino acid:cation symporter [Gammaproteobacteria bacterium]
MPHKHATILLWAILIAVLAGITSGWYYGEATASIAWVGTLFLNALKMTIIPLVVAAMVSGIAALGDVRRLGAIGGVTLLYYAVTTAIAVFIGLVVVNLIQPGAGVTELSGSVPEIVAPREPMGITDILLYMIKPNLIAAAAETQLLPIIIFSLVFGAALTTIGEKGEPLIRFFEGLNEVMMKLVIWLMYLAPIGIFALIAAHLGKAGGGEGLIAELAAVGSYVMTVLAGLAVHSIVLFAILTLIAHRGLAYLVGMMRALLTAFGTASSSATLPLTMECARENDVDARAVRFVLPLGATVNMDGTALYEAVAALFIAQAYGLDLSLTEQTIIFITATLAAIGAAGIPQAGLVTMIIVLQAVNLPMEGIGLILAVDWFLDRFRTAINVWGDSVGAAVVHRYLPESAAITEREEQLVPG